MRGERNANEARRKGRTSPHWPSGIMDPCSQRHSGRNVGVHSAVKQLVFEDVQGGDLIEPSFQLSHQQSQALFNSLWQIGFRPTDGTGNSGHVEALRNHLEDMRRIVFDGATKATKGGAV